ncbi:Lipid A core - O-antigen ligase and related enzymes [Serratia quinivorans]|nr:Lipid A core - O-antigen ligase and related enzymes [Serratia quinivorans]
MLLLAIVAGQAVIAVLQLFLPTWNWVPLRGARVYGIFQQPNVLGSFIATGLALTLMQWLLPGYVLVASRREGVRRVALSLLLVLFSAVLVWIQSRAAWLATLLLVLGFWGCFRHHFSRGLLSASLLIMLGTALGGVVMLWPESAGGVRYISHEMSNQARLAMLQDTLKMIAAHPLSGWGYGSFEYAFQHFRIELVPPTRVLEIARHPHNELLYWWVEGGLVALLGISLLILGGGRLLLQVFRHDAVLFRPVPLMPVRPARYAWLCYPCWYIPNLNTLSICQPCTGWFSCCCWQWQTAFLAGKSASLFSPQGDGCRCAVALAGCAWRRL